jgi:AraC-like DNA-binding protein
MLHRPHFRYLPVLKSQRDWGLYLTDCGYTEIGPNTPYPPQRHPNAYHFDWKKGRTLDEYQVVYITRGSGVFEAKGVRRQSIEAGDLFVLFPGVWHRYAPDPDTGWDEQWIGLNGEIAKRLLKAPFIQTKRPILRIGADEDLRFRFRAVVDTIERTPTGAPFSITGDILKILGLIQERRLGVGSAGRLSAVVREAQNRILRQAEQDIDFPALACALGTSYTSFRRAFKQQSGLAPAQFQSEIRLNRACDFLASTELSVSEIADRTGFDTVFYFSRAFKKKTGATPKTYRTQARSP